MKTSISIIKNTMNASMAKMTCLSSSHSLEWEVHSKHYVDKHLVLDEYTC